LAFFDARFGGAFVATLRALLRANDIAAGKKTTTRGERRLDRSHHRRRRRRRSLLG